MRIDWYHINDMRILYLFYRFLFTSIAFAMNMSSYCITAITWDQILRPFNKRNNKNWAAKAENTQKKPPYMYTDTKYREYSFWLQIFMLQDTCRTKFNTNQKKTKHTTQTHRITRSSTIHCIQIRKISMCFSVNLNAWIYFTQPPPSSCHPSCSVRVNSHRIGRRDRARERERKSQPPNLCQFKSLKTQWTPEVLTSSCWSNSWAVIFTFSNWKICEPKNKKKCEHK